MKKIHLIVGARPNFMKIAPLYKELKKKNNKFQISLIHTGQHYDEKMSKFFFTDLQLPEPDEHLGVGSGTHAIQTAKIMERYETTLFKDRPDLIVVAGDVNSTAACALDAVKLGIPVAHLEAGLRSFDRSMPEEINRVITDAVSDILLTPSQDADENLLNEGISADKVFFVGNIMIDSLIVYQEKAKESKIRESLRIDDEDFCLVTLHRPANVDNEGNLSTIMHSLQEISKELKVIFPVHPRTRKNLRSNGLEDIIASSPNFILTEPLSYYDFLNLQMNSLLIITDSGGIQEESTYFRIPCLTIRPNTERPITITKGTNKLLNLFQEEIVAESLRVISVMRDDNPYLNREIPELWDGKTAQRVVMVLEDWLDRRKN